MADNCIDVYYKLDRYYLTGNSIDFALNYKDLGGGCHGNDDSRKMMCLPTL